MTAERRPFRIPGWRSVAFGAIVLVAGAAQARSRSTEADAQRFYRLGQAQYEQGKIQMAIDSLKKALDLDPRLAEAHGFLGVIYLGQSDPGQAAKHLKKAIDLNPYYTDAHNALGVAYKELKKYDRALEEFETALKDTTYASPEKVHFNLGKLYLEREEIPEAIRSFDQALKIRPDYLPGILGLGQAYQRSGRADLARQQFQKVVRLRPDSAEAAEARQLLDRQGKRAGS